MTADSGTGPGAGGNAFNPRASEQAIGTRLAVIRRHAHMTQADVAKVLSYSQSRVDKVEHGSRRLTLTDAIELAGLYGVSILDLLDPADWGPRPHRRRRDAEPRRT